MKKTLSGSLALVAALAAAAGANAALVTMSGSCAANCSELGLATGDAVSARFELAISAAENQTLGRAQVTGFSVNLGNIAFDGSDLANWDFFLTTNAAGQVSNFQFLASFGSSASHLADSIDLRLPWWAASHHGTCRSGIDGQPSACDFASSGNNFGYAGLMSSGDHPDVSLTMAVPEPSALALAGLSLAALAATARRRGQAASIRA
ncbi:MAG: PEP-CTERM sorting domain-containing protein [Burkholderiaceae bacterium]|nr:PEP-CTERM sorting domain-containing protein [Burkholderiaceae bacterium]